MMQSGSIFRIFGLLLMLLSTSFIVPIMVEQWYQDGSIWSFHCSFALTFSVGFLFWFIFRNHHRNLRTQDGFLVVVLFWFIAGLVGALPFYFSHYLGLSITDALFESVSGITTTGSTILTELDYLPHAILYYRQQLEFLGGIGIIILAVAIMPTFNIGGMQLFRTEITGPIKDNKMMPRVTQTAKAIWFIYVLMTVLCALGYWLAGMSLFDAVGHSFSTVSTGGFSTHNASLNFYPNPYIKIIAIVFMFLGAVNFGLHYLVFKRKSLHVYFQDPEFKAFVKIIFSAVILIWVALIFYTHKLDASHSFLDTLFQAVSFMTTSGYTSIDVSSWPPFVPLLLLFLAILGGCAGSTASGLKMIRVLLLQKQGTREIKRIIHPHGQYVVKLGDKALSPTVIEAIWGFFVIYCVTFAVLLLLLMNGEQDFLTVYSALVASISNTGTGLGEVAHNFAGLSDYSKWILTLAMIVGRLEILTLLVLFTPMFWRR